MPVPACTAWTATMPKPAARPPRLLRLAAAAALVPRQWPLRCRTTWTWWRLQHQRQPQGLPRLAFHHAAAAARARQAQAVRAAPHRRPRPWRPTSPSWKPAARWPFCAKTASKALKKFLPPPSRRALVLCDPSYEIKTDYARSPPWWAMRSSALPPAPMPCGTPSSRGPKPTTCRASSRRWPPRRARAGCNARSRSNPASSPPTRQATVRPGLPASGMFMINPPHTLKAALQAALPQLVELLGQDRNAAFALESGG
jgi:hypothetical protein